MSVVSWRRRRVLVTGATGFIGSHLTRRLVREGADVHISVRSEANLWRLEQVRDSVFMHAVDLRDQMAVETTCRAIQPEIVYHLAAYGVSYGEQEITQALDVNVRGTVNLVRALINTSATLIHTGTWAEYGAKTQPMAENDVLEPRGAYGSTKAAATVVARAMARDCGLPTIVLRPFSVYGPAEGADKFVPYVILSLLSGEVPQLTSCRQIRNYIYIDDVIEAYLAASAVATADPQTVNIACADSVSLTELVNSISSVCGRGPVAFGSLPHRQDEIWEVHADVSMAKRLLGWEAQTPLLEGLRLTTEWFEHHRYPRANAAARARRMC